MSFSSRLVPSVAAATALAALAAPGEARADGKVSISPGIVFAGTFGDKSTFGLGLDVRAAGLLKGKIGGCSNDARMGVGPFAQALWLNFSKAVRFTGGVHGGGEALAQKYALEGELGWTYRTRLDDSPGGHGIHFGLTQALVFGIGPSPELALRGSVSWLGPRVVPEITTALSIRWPATFGFEETCIIGRPLRVDGEVVLPDVSLLGACEARALPADPDVRAAIARAWLDDARGECASIPAFAALARDLVIAGAPASLVQAALSAMDDEIRHTAMCTIMAGDLSGAMAIPHLPPPPPLRDADRARLLERLAIESWEDGCLGEGAAAARARRAAANATDPAARAVLSRIAADEQRHADLGLRVLEFCLAAAPSLRDAIADRALVHTPTAPIAERSHDDPDLARALGRLAPRDADEAWEINFGRSRARAEILLAA